MWDEKGRERGLPTVCRHGRKGVGKTAWSKSQCYFPASSVRHQYEIKYRCKPYFNDKVFHIARSQMYKP